MKPALIVIFWVVLSVITTIEVLSQDALSEKQHYVQLKDGTELLGVIENQNDSTTILITDNLGRLTIQNNKIKTLHEVDSKQLKNGVYWKENAQSTRYFFAPNGYGLKQGEGYYQNVMVMFNQASIGISDYFSIGVGLVPIFLFGVAETPVWITPKFSIPVKKDKFNIGIGGLMGTVIGANESYGVVFSSITFGGKDKNVNLGFGWGYSNNGFAKSPTLNFSYMSRITARTYFITENYYIDGGSAFKLTILSIGWRTLFNKFGLDYGLIYPIEKSSGFILVPWIGFIIPFGES